MRFVGTIAGGGKTYAALEYAAEWAALGHRFIIALPSQLVIDKCVANMQHRHPDIGCAGIHGGTDHQRVLGAIISKIKKIRSIGNVSGYVLLITHAALERLPQCFRDGWKLIVDEVPNVTSYFEHNQLTRGIRAALNVVPAGAKYCRLIPKNKWLWRRIASGKSDIQQSHGIRFTHHKYKALAAALLNPNVDVYGITQQWTDKALDDPANQVCMFSVLNPSVFDGFSGEPVVMSACIQDTMLWHLWTVRNGVEWIEHKGISKRVRATEHTNGKLLSVYYATERDFSKTLRDREAMPNSGDPSTVQHAIAVASLRLFNSPDFAYMCNKDSTDAVAVSLNDLGVQLPNTPHGLNDYQGLHNCAVFSALNLTPAHIKFLSSFGSSGDEIRRAISYQATYQAALRISLRNPDDENKKILVVQDKGCADYIANLFPGSVIRLLDTGLMDIRSSAKKGRGRDVKSADVKREYRLTKRADREIGVYLIDCVQNVRQTYNIIGVSDKMDASQKPVGMSVFLDKKTSKPFAEIPWTGVEDFVELLRCYSTDTHKNKEDNRLISPSIFDQKLAEMAGEFNEFGKAKSRARVNVVSSVGIWLDNDLGVLTHQEFAELFADLQMVIYNTYSSKADAPKYRVWIPTSHAMSADIYLFITAQIRAKIESHGVGYRSGSWLIKWIMKYQATHGHLPDDTDVPFANHGFDWSKTMPENLMYLPCRAADPDPDASFFYDLRGGLRKPLDVMAWISHPIIDTRPASDPEPVAVIVHPAPVANTGSAAKQKLVAYLLAQQQQNTQARQQHKVAKALSDWHSLPPGYLYEGFFTLGCKLAAAGLDLSDVRQHLIAESTPGSDRRARVRGIIDSLRKRDFAKGL